MISYKIDDKKTYDEEIKTLLRKHNAKYSDINNRSSIYIYVMDQNQLIGALEASFFWDWVSINQVFYRDRKVLKDLVNNLYQTFKEKAEGMILYTTVKKRLDDFVSTGFKLSEAIKLTELETYYYAHLISLEGTHENIFEVIIDNKPMDAYQKILEEKEKTFNEEHHIFDVSDIFDMAVLDNDLCIGGIQCEVYGDMLYISRLVVDERYQNQKLGSILTKHAIDFAIEKKLPLMMLGTTDFQAKGFYEKLGFEVVHERDHHPKGYKSYTMLKRLKY